MRAGHFKGKNQSIFFFYFYRANHHLVNNAGQNPLEIAVANSDADIVTLLRLAALNEQIRENDFTGDDDTFNDVVQAKKDTSIDFYINTFFKKIIVIYRIVLKTAFRG